MALNAAVLELIVRYCRRDKDNVGQALVAGYPDLLVNGDDLQRLGILEPPREADGAAGIVASHSWSGQVFDSAWLFQQLGYTMKVVDIRRQRGCEIVKDLNYEHDLGQFDLCLDHGTVEHCFNIGVAARNLARSVAIGGHMVQHLPMNMYGHGFYNLCPEWFRAFYGHMGFEVIFLQAWHRRHGYLDTNLRGRFGDVPDDSLLSMVALKRCEAKQGFPTQEIYRR